MSVVISHTKGLCCHKPGEKLTVESIPVRAPQDDDVGLRVDYCGICHSDLHYANGDWKSRCLPLTPGHEIVGTVISVGSKVSKFKEGDYVAVGCMVNSCGTCPQCKAGCENFCEKGNTLTFGSIDPKWDGKQYTRGGYSRNLVVDEKFCLTVPKNLHAAGTAPLLCAGITVYSPLKRFGSGSGKKVGVVGLGGLGHMAVLIAKAMGASVTLFSRSMSKYEEASSLGFDDYCVSTSEEEMTKRAGTLDIIIDTVPYVHDCNPYVAALAPKGTLVVVGYLGPFTPELNSGPLVRRNKAVAGSLIGGIKETQEMIDFCAKHDISAVVEVIKPEDVNDAYKRLLKGDVKYRFVIDNKYLD